MANRRTHIVIPEELAVAIDSLVGKRGRSRFLTEAAWFEVRRRQIHALRRAAGSLNPKDYPEFRHGSARWVAKMRQEGEKRFRRLFPAARR